MPKGMWNGAALAGVCITNRNLTNAVSESKTPIEMWTKQKANRNELQGCSKSSRSESDNQEDVQPEATGRASFWFWSQHGDHEDVARLVA